MATKIANVAVESNLHPTASEENVACQERNNDLALVMSRTKSGSVGSCRIDEITSLILTRISRLVSPFVFASNHDSALPSPFSPSPSPLPLSGNISMESTVSRCKDLKDLVLDAIDAQVAQSPFGLAAPSIAEHIWVQLESLPAHQIISHALFTQRTYQLIAIHSPFSSSSLTRAKSVRIQHHCNTTDEATKEDATKDVEAEQPPAKGERTDTEAKYKNGFIGYILPTLYGGAGSSGEGQASASQVVLVARAQPEVLGRVRQAAVSVTQTTSAPSRNLKCSAVSAKPRFLSYACPAPGLRPPSVPALRVKTRSPTSTTPTSDLPNRNTFVPYTTSILQAKPSSTAPPTSFSPADHYSDLTRSIPPYSAMYQQRQTTYPSRQGARP
ncbi:hypothetical protein K438DRAFT_2031676 [Mycena galopus ATCC 62051]|nr:hypothetical protein K438DRAFT_2031676 [Mycena galopus ATCC 62051]